MKLTPAKLAKEAEKAYYKTLYANVIAWEARERLAWLAVGEWIALLLKPKDKPASEKVAVQHMCPSDDPCAGCGEPTKLVFSVGEVRMRACCKQCAVKALKGRM